MSISITILYALLIYAAIGCLVYLLDRNSWAPFLMGDLVIYIPIFPWVKAAWIKAIKAALEAKEE